MLMTLIPLFDEEMKVKAYSVFAQKNNYLLNPMMMGTARFDGATSIQGLEVIQAMGIETISDDVDIFVPISNINVFTDVDSQCGDIPHNRIVFLIDNTIPPIDMYISRLEDLKKRGFGLAIRKLAVSEFESYKAVLQLMDYVFLNNKKVAIDKAKIYFSKLYPHIKLCAGNIETAEIFEQLKKGGGYQFYEGVFYRTPLTKGEKEVAPLKVNYIKLLNIVNSENFELSEAADTIGRDTALTISLLRMVNNMTVNSGITTIRHAAAMLGQRELKKWINTAVVNALCADKANEVTRLSLLRAKFAENLAPAFEMAALKDELFLMGLFSVLDVILDRSMEEALNMMTVADDIKKALVDRTGKLVKVYDFMIQYEEANWPEISRQMIIENLDDGVITGAYMDALEWYKNVMTGKN